MTLSVLERIRVLDTALSRSKPDPRWTLLAAILGIRPGAGPMTVGPRPTPAPGGSGGSGAGGWAIVAVLALALLEKIVERRATPESSPTDVMARAEELDREVHRAAEQIQKIDDDEGLPCEYLPEWYQFSSPQDALHYLKQETGDHSLSLGKKDESTEGPCPGRGVHIAVRRGGRYIATIVCCPCLERGRKVTRCGILYKL